MSSSRSFGNNSAPWAIVTLACVCHTDVVAAQDNPFKFELTPYAGYRVGGQFEEENGDGEFEINESSAQGIILNIRADFNNQWEVLYAHQDTELRTSQLFAGDPVLDLDIEYFHFGGTYLFEGEDTRPFVALTAGLSRFDPQLSDLSTESYFSASIGGGVQLRASKRIGVRIEGRVFTSYVGGDTDIFCRSTGGINSCAIRVEGSTLTQWEFRAGLAVHF